MPVYNDNGRELSIGERFKLQAEQKLRAADNKRIEDAEKQAEALKNNFLVRWYATLNGEVLSDTDALDDEELRLFESVEDPETELTVDENGRLCLVSEYNARKAAMASEKAAANAEEALSAAAKARRAALHSALNVSSMENGQEDAQENEEDGVNGARIAAAMRNKGARTSGDAPQLEGTAQPEGADAGTVADTVTEEENKETHAAPVPEEPLTPVNPDTKVMRLEDIGFVNARVYIAVAKNKEMNEQAYGVYVEQGYGESRSVLVHAERVHGDNIVNMAYRAATAALSRYTNIGQPISSVTIFIDRALGWELEQNSWALATDAFNMDADLYSQTFRSCEGHGVQISIAPAEASCNGQEMAKYIAESLIRVPQ